MITYALDFESYYDDDCSITTLGPVGYFNHPSFDAYMVTVVGDDGFEYAGHPAEFPWALLHGERVLSHNASFDESLYLFGVEKGWYEKVEPAEWHCTADMVAYLGMPRSLAGAIAWHTGEEVVKTTRDNMKGKRWEDMSHEFREEVTEYAIIDSVKCMELWKDLSDGWPEFERRVSAANRKMVQRGLPVNPIRIREAVESLGQQLFDLEEAIPWKEEAPLLSRKAFDTECRKHGLTPPKSLDQNSPAAVKWIKSNCEKHRWISSATDWRKVNGLYKRMQAFENSSVKSDTTLGVGNEMVKDYDPHYRLYSNLMYWGGHTGRFSGSGGSTNLQNLNKGTPFGVDVRSMVEAPKGKTFAIIDLSQIEVRTLCYLAEDWKMLDSIKNSQDIYQTFAERFGLWTPDMGVLSEENPGLRSKPVKPMVLGCGYGAGPRKISDLYDMPFYEAMGAVNTYRSTMSTVTDLWDKYDHGLKMGYYNVKPFHVSLPSGRSMRYEKIRRKKLWSEPRSFTYVNKDGETVVENKKGYWSNVTMVQQVRNGAKRMTRVWGGTVAENVSQALARDIFVDKLLDLEKAKLPTIFHVHDEAVLELDEVCAQEQLEEAISIMSTHVEWAEQIPLAADGFLSKVYTK